MPRLPALPAANRRPHCRNCGKLLPPSILSITSTRRDHVPAESAAVVRVRKVRDDMYQIDYWSGGYTSYAQESMCTMRCCEEWCIKNVPKRKKRGKK